MQNNEQGNLNQPPAYIIDKRVGKGRLVLIDNWCKERSMTIQTIRNWSLTFDFQIIKIGSGKYAYESALNDALQKHIENEDAAIERRRANARDLAFRKREAFRNYLDQLAKGFKGNKPPEGFKDDEEDKV